MYGMLFISVDYDNFILSCTVNNVGLSYECPDVLHEQPADVS